MTVYAMPDRPGRGSIFYIDNRHIKTPDKISLDISRHLPPRLALGPAVIINDRPLVLLSVIKKRWTRVIQGVERQYASTLDRSKKETLKHELSRLRTYRFSAKAFKEQEVDILFLASAQLLPDAKYMTTYLTGPIEDARLPHILAHLRPGGMLVIYSGADEVEGAASSLKA
jgi:hypothetical protein